MYTPRITVSRTDCGSFRVGKNMQNPKRRIRRRKRKKVALFRQRLHANAPVRAEGDGDSLSRVVAVEDEEVALVVEPPIAFTIANIISTFCATRTSFRERNLTIGFQQTPHNACSFVLNASALTCSASTTSFNSVIVASTFSANTYASRRTLALTCCEAEGSMISSPLP